MQRWRNPRDGFGLSALVVTSAALLACEGPRVRQDLDFYEDAGVDAAAGGAADSGLTTDARAPTPTPADALAPDARPPETNDALAPDARPPEPNDAVAPDAAGPAPDARVTLPDVAQGPDVGQVTADAAPDASADAAPDAGAPPPPDAADPPPMLMLRGTAHAADPLEPVVVTDLNSGLSTTTQPPSNAFALGPLAPGAEAALVFSAAHHQSESLVWAPTPAAPDTLAEDVLLYRGRRISPETTATRPFFAPDEDYLLYTVGESLAIAGTGADAAAARLLVPDAYELFLGYTPDGSSAVARRRNRPGLAGDVDAYPLAGGPPQPLFEEAQPWVRWLDDRALGMEHTQAALSRLVLGRPGGPKTVLAEGVPWLLVTRMQSGAVAYASGAAPRYPVALDALGAGAPRVVSPNGDEAGDGFLMTSPDNRRLYWRTPEGALQMYSQDTDTSVTLAENVLASPRPLVQPGGTVFFWRGQAAGHEDLYVLGGAADAVERRRAVDVDGRTLVTTVDGFYVAAPGRGLLHGLRDAGPEAGVVVPGQTVQFVTSGPGVIALADGHAWTHVPGNPPTDRGGAGLAQLEIAPRGATAFAGGGVNRLFYVPAPDLPGDVFPLAGGRPMPQRVTEPARSAVYVRDAGGWLNWTLPPSADAPGRPFGSDAERTLPVTPEWVMQLDAAGALWAAPTDAERRVPWAWHVQTLERSPQRALAAYVCDRGVFVVPLADAAP